MSTLRVHGTFHNVGLPDKPLPELTAFDFTGNGAQLTGSHIGNREGALAMLKLAAEKIVNPMIETIDTSEAGCKEAVKGVKTNKVRYRVMLTGFEKTFGERVVYN